MLLHLPLILFSAAKEKIEKHAQAWTTVGLQTPPRPTPTPSALFARRVQLWFYHVTCGCRAVLYLRSRRGRGGGGWALVVGAGGSIDGWRNKLVKVSITDWPRQIPLLKAKPGLALHSARSALFNSASWGISLVSEMSLRYEIAQEVVQAYAYASVRVEKRSTPEP